MALVRPRLTDYYGISISQTDLDFAIPFFDEDLPLYVDPFLLWKSPSLQDQALHTSLINSFNYQNWLIQKGRENEAQKNLICASECNEVGLGFSAKRKGKRLGPSTVRAILELFRRVPEYGRFGFTHFEEIQLYVDGISKDRVSDFTCNFLMSFLIDYTAQQCLDVGLPLTKVQLPALYDYRQQRFVANVDVELPVHPIQGTPIVLVPKRWLRFVPWINFEDYFEAYCPKDEVISEQGSTDRVLVLTYNRSNYGVVADYVKAKERTAVDCRNDPLFKQIPILSARRKLKQINALSTGKSDNADKQYEDAISQLLPSILYPHLDFADTQTRSIGGSTIRDLVFYNNRSVDFLEEILDDYHSRQLVMELKNVHSIDRENINQLNRYLTNEFGAFGVLVTRNPLPKAMFKNTIELWSGQRRAIVALVDSDLEMMVEVFDSKQRAPIEVLKKKYIEFRRACPL
jgi:hypothetical protein